MSYDVLIRKNDTGEIRRCRFEGVDWYADSSDYLWTDGNYGCDCNLADFFAQAGGEFDPEKDHPCGNEKYTPIKAILPDGSEVEICGEE